MPVQISLIMGCRVGDNENSNLGRFLKSACDRLSPNGLVELLVKFDDNDPGRDKAIAEIEQYQERLPIRYITTPRGIGYGDLHKAYADLFFLTAPESRIFWVISDDIEIDFHGEGHWDDYMLELSHAFADDIFVMHPRELLGYGTQTQRDILESPDPYPAWSREWILRQGGFGPTFSTDGWTGLVEHCLFNDYQTDRRIYMPELKYKRYECAADMPGSERFNGIRRVTHDKMLSPQGQVLKNAIARNIYQSIPQPPPPPPPPPPELGIKQLAKMLLRRIYRRIFS